MRNFRVVLSGDKMYRYRYEEWWTEERLAPRTMTWIMLNPAHTDDYEHNATFRRCRAFAQREACDGMIVVNLYAYCATDPRDLRTAETPEGKANVGWVTKITGARGPVVAAWGSGVPKGMPESHAKKMLDGWPGLLCLGKTATGEPRHPLRVPEGKEFEPYAFT